MARTSKTVARKSTRNTKARKVTRIENPFTRPFNGEAESKSAKLFNLLNGKRGVSLETLAEELDSTPACVRVRISQLKANGFNVENIGARGDPTFKLVA